MGAYLSEPNLNKNSEDDGNEKITYGASSMQGWRLEQEVNCFRTSFKKRQALLMQSFNKFEIQF